MTARALAVALAVLVTAPLPAAPRLKAEKPTAPTLAGTSWVGKTAEGWDMTLDFAAGGAMTVSYNKTTFNKASWRQEGDKVYYEMNDRYCQFEGTFVGEAIEGQSHNVAGRRWDTRLTRLKP
jgi:hypothetical protein